MPQAFAVGIESVRDVCDVRVVTGRAADPRRPPALLLEVPHGAARRRHFDATRSRLVGELPEDLESFFFVNTDVGAAECALEIARRVARPEDYPELSTRRGDRPHAPVSVLIVRGLVPRTFVDCNRDVEVSGDAFRAVNLTAAVPSYIRRDEDVRTLAGLHRAYQDVASRAYEVVCGQGGIAFQLHTYAPRSVEIDEVGDDIVRVLREAYEPDRYARWKQRPDVDLITAIPGGSGLAPPRLTAAIRDRFGRAGIEVAENETYHLHPGTAGHRHASTYPGQVLSLEISRGRLADPFTPFAPMHIGRRKVRRMTAPLADALLDVSSASSGSG